MVVRRLTRSSEAHRRREGEWRCHCEELLDSTYEIDHRVPLWRGGADHIDNCWALHAHCHAKKTQAEEVERLHARFEASRTGRPSPFPASGTDRLPLLFASLLVPSPALVFPPCHFPLPGLRRGGGGRRVGREEGVHLFVQCPPLALLRSPFKEEVVHLHGRRFAPRVRIGR